ncbi:MAG: T9SS type A sorting domain-containing protein [Salinivirgaceae bacterium]|nr:T9SS type A sorting domain-containing protein [Salinivirgaceae bacterium]
MKFIFTNVLIFTLINLCSSQTFETTFWKTEGSQQAQVIELSDEKFIVSDLVLQPDYNYYQKFFLFDKYGALLTTTEFENELFWSMKAVGLDSILLLGNETINDSTSNIVVKLVNSNFEELHIDKKEVEFPFFNKALLLNWNDTLFFLNIYKNYFNQPETKYVFGRIDKQSFEIVDTVIQTINLNSCRLFLGSVNGDFYLIEGWAKKYCFTNDFTFIADSRLGDGHVIGNYDAMVLPDSSHYILNGFNSEYSMENEDLALIKTDANLNVQEKYLFELDYPTNRVSKFTSFAQHPNYFIMGATVNFDQHPTTFVTKLDYDFNVSWQKEISSTDPHYLSSVTSTKNGGAILISIGNNSDSTTDYSYLRIIKMNANGGYNSIFIKRDFENTVSIYPNPASHNITIKCKRAHLPNQLIITNNIGKVVLEAQLKTEETTLNISQFEPGTYVYQLNNGRQIIGWGKFIKE